MSEAKGEGAAVFRQCLPLLAEHFRTDLRDGQYVGQIRSRAPSSWSAIRESSWADGSQPLRRHVWMRPI